MKYSLAPMEGITGYIYRRAYHTFFGNVDKYYTPFIKPGQKGHFSSREKNDISKEHNQGMNVVVQQLTNSSEDFIRTARKIEQLGYEEINLNLGCPAKMVVNKGRGSGFLANPEALDQFFDEIFSEIKTDISVKTRIGKDDPEEFYKLIEIYNKYPIKELIIHPRLQRDYYKNVPNLDVFRDAVRLSKIPLCYNGDICTKSDDERIRSEFPDISHIMIGRGILSDPGLLAELRGEQRPGKQTVRAFHDQIYSDYQEVMSGERNILFKMKELWGYLNHSFTNSEKYAKKIRKAERLYRYEEVVDALFAEQELKR